MKKSLILLFAIALTLTTKAQDKGKTILDGVCTQTNAYTTIDISFSYTMENPSKKLKEVKTGTACMKGDKYWMSFAGQEIISDGKTIWTYIKDNNEVQINTVDPNDDQSLNPAKLLTGYSKSFTPKFIKEETRGSKILQVIDLTPLKARSYYKIRVEIDKVKKQISRAIVYDKNGTTTYTYDVTKFTPNTNISDSKFTFRTSDHPGVEVIDLR